VGTWGLGARQPDLHLENFFSSLRSGARVAENR